MYRQVPGAELWCSMAGRVVARFWPREERMGPTFDVYRSAVDGIWVVHVDTKEIEENEEGPRIRIYLNDEEIHSNPPYPGPQERS